MIASNRTSGDWAFAPRTRQDLGVVQGVDELPNDTYYMPVPADDTLEEFLENVAAERRQPGGPWLQFRISTALWLTAAAASMFGVARLYHEQAVWELGLVLYGTLLLFAPLLVFLVLCALPKVDGKTGSLITLVILGALVMPLLFSMHLRPERLVLDVMWETIETIPFLLLWWAVLAGGIAGVWKVFHHSRRAEL